MTRIRASAMQKSMGKQVVTVQGEKAAQDAFVGLFGRGPKKGGGPPTAPA